MSNTLDEPYPYYKHIKNPRQLKMSDKGTLNQAAKNVTGLIDYVEVLTTGKSRASGNKYLGDKKFVDTGVTCDSINGLTDFDKKNGITKSYRSIYIDNIPNENALGGFVDVRDLGLKGAPKGLVPGVLYNILDINPFNIVKAMGSSNDSCVKVKLKTINNQNVTSSQEGYIRIDDINGIHESNFVGTNKSDVKQLIKKKINNTKDPFGNMISKPKKNTKKAIKDTSKKNLNKPFIESLDKSAPFYTIEPRQIAEDIDNFNIFMKYGLGITCGLLGGYILYHAVKKNYNEK
jgi:hypothetical protein